MKNTMTNTLIDFGFSTLEASYLALGHMLETEDEFSFKQYKVDSHFDEGFTLIEATLEKGVKGAIWNYTEYEY